jgi:hypothetical protein
MFLVDARASTLVWHDKVEDVRHDFGLLCDMSLSSAVSTSLEWECSHAPIMGPKLDLYSNQLPGQLLSQHFHWKHRMRTSTVHQPSAQKVISKWRNEPHRWTQAVSRLSKWRYKPKKQATFANPESCEVANTIQDEDERKRLRSFADAVVFNSSLLTLTHFRASVAAHLCRIEAARHVLDFSAGWGDRLTGFLSSPCVESITLVDPRGGSMRACRKQHSFVGSTKELLLRQGPAEDVLPTLPSNSFDLILTSPPYFDLECYGETEAEAQNQIRSRVSSLDLYHSSFLSPVLEQCSRLLCSDGGLLALNVDDNPRRGVHICQKAIDLCLSFGLVPVGTSGLRKGRGFGNGCQSRVPLAEPIYLFRRVHEALS